MVFSGTDVFVSDAWINNLSWKPDSKNHHLQKPTKRSPKLPQSRRPVTATHYTNN